MESSSQFAEILFNLFFCLIIIVYAGFNVDYYEKIRKKPSQAITATESDSMFYVSAVILAFSIAIFAYFIYRIFSFREKEEKLFVSQSNSRATLDRFNLESMGKRNPQFFNQSVRDLGNIKQSYQDAPPLYKPKNQIIGRGF
jgi:hypothetical protein